MNAGSSPPFAWVPASAAPTRLEITARCREANRMISSLLGCAVANGPLYEAAATPARPPDAVRRATTTTPCGKSAPGRTSSPSARGARRGAEDGSRGAAEASARRTAASMLWRPLIACAGGREASSGARRGNFHSWISAGLKVYEGKSLRSSRGGETAPLARVSPRGEIKASTRVSDNKATFVVGSISRRAAP